MRKLIILCGLLIPGSNAAQDVVLNRADSLYSNGNFSEAIAVYKAYDQPSDVYDKIARAYMAIGNYDEALDSYEASLKAHPENMLTAYDYAKLLSKTKKYQKASQLFGGLIERDSLNPNYHYELGLVLERLEDSTAMNEYVATYRLDTTHQKAIFKIAKHHLIKREHDSALVYINKGLESYENNVELISLKAQNFYVQGYFSKAKVWFQKLVDLGESSEFIHEKLSLCHADNSDYELAIAQRKLALRYNPYNADALFVIGTYYDRLQDFENAEKYIRQALLLKDVPLDYEYQRLGTVLNRQKKYELAIDAFQKSVRENPENSHSAFYEVLTKDKYYADIDTKIKLYETFKERYPESYYVTLVDRRISELKTEKFTKAKE